MADNVALPAVYGTEVATDEVGGVHFQRVKLDLGGDGISQPVDGALPVANDNLTSLGGLVRTEDTEHQSGDTGIMVLAVREDNETTLAIPSGDYTPLQVNSAGRLKCSTQPGMYPLVTGDITVVGQSVFCEVSRASNVQMHIVANSLVGHVSAFEGSLDSTDGTDGNWFSIQAVRSNANSIETSCSTLAATPTYSWEASVNGLSFVRVRSTAHTSGTATWKFQRGSYATEPIPAAQTTSFTAATVTVNSETTTNLGSSATFTGSSRDGGSTLRSRTFTANFYADVASAANGCIVDKSSNGTTWYPCAVDTLSAGVPLTIQVMATTRYHRVRMINGAGAQTSMFVSSAYHTI